MNEILSSSGTNVPYIIRNWEIRDMEGKLLTLIETMGLQEKQESAIKGLIRQVIWTMVDSQYRAILPSELEEKVFPSRTSEGVLGKKAK